MSIHVGIQVRSKYIPDRARLYVCFLGIIRRISRDGLKLPGIRNDIPEDPKAGVCERDHASTLGAKGQATSKNRAPCLLAGYRFVAQTLLSEELYVLLREIKPLDRKTFVAVIQIVALLL